MIFLTLIEAIETNGSAQYVTKFEGKQKIMRVQYKVNHCPMDSYGVYAKFGGIGIK